MNLYHYTLKTLLFKLDIKHFSNDFFVSCYFEDRSRKKRKRKRKKTSLDGYFEGKEIREGKNELNLFNLIYNYMKKS